MYVIPMRMEIICYGFSAAAVVVCVFFALLWMFQSIQWIKRTSPYFFFGWVKKIALNSSKTKKEKIDFEEGGKTKSTEFVFYSAAVFFFFEKFNSLSLPPLASYIEEFEINKEFLSDQQTKRKNYIINSICVCMLCVFVTTKTEH